MQRPYQAPHSRNWKRARHRLSRLAAPLKYLWALPNTAPGLALIPPAVVAGGHVRMVDGVLEVHGPLVRAILRGCVPLPGGAAAITLGHVVLGRDEATLHATRSHERMHVRQCEIWGPAFIPAYLLAAAWGWMSGAGAYQGNYFEQQARRCDCLERDTATG